MQDKTVQSLADILSHVYVVEEMGHCLYGRMDDEEPELQKIDKHWLEDIEELQVLNEATIAISDHWR